MLADARLRLAGTLQLEVNSTWRELLSFIEAVSNDVPPYSDYYLIADVTPAALPREWRNPVLDDPCDPGAFNRRLPELRSILGPAATRNGGSPLDGL